MMRGSIKGSHSPKSLTLGSGVLKQNTQNAPIPYVVEQRILATKRKRTRNQGLHNRLQESFAGLLFHVNLRQLLDPYFSHRICRL